MQAAATTGPAWRFHPPAGDHALALGAALDLPPAVAQVLINRGFGDLARARGFLQPRLAQLTPPTAMAGLQVGVERLAQALRRGERIGVFGDYDVDGVSAAAVLGDYLRGCGADLRLRVARRDEGYGLHPTQANELVAAGCRVLLLADCGTADVNAVAAATAAGADVVALDHHRVLEGAWPGLALINPQRPDCGFLYKGLCSAGLAFYFTGALRRVLAAEGRAAPDPRAGLDLVALGTVADVAPLDGVNRILVARGLEGLAETSRPGLRELLRLAAIEGRAVTAEDVAWRLGPRLNAPGRLGDAGLALEALAERDPARAVAAARRCDALNGERKALQERLLAEARAQAQEQGERSFYLLASEGWHPGVIGIVAGRLAAERRRPVAVVAIEGELGRGSARSVPGLDLVEVLRCSAAALTRFGGHAAAAGFTVERSKLALLAASLEQATAGRLAGLEPPGLTVDALVELERVDEPLCGALARLAPFGQQNAEPILASAAVAVVSVRSVGSGHLALTLRQGEGVPQQAIAFGFNRAAPAVGSRVDLAFVPELDSYRRRGVRLRVQALLPAGEGVELASLREASAAAQP
ncbi:MAG: single-stranded-DNA-specific exonuclease RecJ [Proteobacteria bacterium]|nr:single-stranded-DNA-specific exonuclease RecJ [Pseudomonadota bacterium]